VTDIITLSDLSTEEIKRILRLGAELKERWRRGGNEPLLDGKTLGMVFQKPSLRTRVSFEMGMSHLGGRAMYLSPSEVGLGRREAVQDVARVLSRYVDGVMARVFDHRDVEQLAHYSDVPVINGLSDRFHPCQALADMLTLIEKLGDLDGKKLAYAGDGNNVLRSLLLCAPRLGMDVTVATPQGYGLDSDSVSLASELASDAGGRITLQSDPQQAVRDADVIYTDAWASMGQEDEREERLAVFPPYQVNERLIDLAKPDVVVMHCLPAHRGEEITDVVIDGNHSIVYDQAENRLHAQKAVLLLLLKGE
jgi:ornithine carbamoyltransferase